MDHPMIGKSVTYEKDGREASGTVTESRAGPMFVDGSAKVRAAKVHASIELRIVPDDGSDPFWAGPFECDPLAA